VRRVAGLLLLMAGRAMAQEPPAAAPPAVTLPPPKRVPAKLPPAVTAVTLNAARDVVIGALDKRTGETRSFTGRPGQFFIFKGLRVRVRACETTPPWDVPLTGAFLQIDEALLRGGTRRAFSGWMFKESPSLHPLEHPRYDIWVKSCAMRFPDSGPDTVVAGKPTGTAPKPLSSAKKSPAMPSASPSTPR
jgi:hypothetical protein